MRNRIARRSCALLVAVPLLFGCATPGGPSPIEVIGRGLAGLVLSPLMIVAGVAQGIGFLPYTLGTSLTELNRGLVQAQAVTLDDSYKATFNVPVDDPRVNKQTGEIAGATGLYGRYRSEAIFEATRAFQRLLVAQGMPPATAEGAISGRITVASRRVKRAPLIRAASSRLGPGDGPGTIRPVSGDRDLLRCQRLR